MKRTLLGTTLLAGLLVGGAYWAGQDDNDLIGDANAAPEDEEEKDIGGKIVLLKLAVPAGDEVGDIIRKDASLSAGFDVIDRRSIPADLIKDTGFKLE